MVDKSKNRVRYWIKSLKHGFNFRLPLYARFHQDRPAHTFHVDYLLSISNHPKVTKGKLTIEVKQGEQS